MSLAIKGSSRPALTLFVFIIIAIIVGSLITTLDYFWVMLIPNLFLLALTVTFLTAYFEMGKPRHLQKLEKYPSLTVLIPCFNSLSTIKKCLSTIKASEYPGEMEIMVIDDGSTDGSREWLKEQKGITVMLKEKNAGKAAALNSAIPAAKGTIVACVDSDTYLEKHTLKHAVEKLLENKDFGAVTCFIKVANPDNLLKKIQQIEYYTGFGFAAMVTSFLDAIFVTPGPTTVFRKDALVKIGMYDEKNITEDLEIAWRLRKFGYRIAYSVNSIVHTEVPSNIKDLLRQRLRWYRGKLFNLRKYSDMMFNPKYGNFGIFVFPFSFSAELAGLVLTFSFGFILSKQIIWLSRLLNSYWYLNSFTLDMSGFVVVGTSAIVMGLILVLPWFFAVYISHAIAKKKATLTDIPSIFLFLIFYGTFISFVYSLSFFKEVNRSDYKW